MSNSAGEDNMGLEFSDMRPIHRRQPTQSHFPQIYRSSNTTTGKPSSNGRGDWSETSLTMRGQRKHSPLLDLGLP